MPADPTPSTAPAFRALRHGRLTLHRITAANADEVRAMLREYDDADELLPELDESYLPEADDRGRVTRIGFWATRDDPGAAGRLVGLSLLGVDDWDHLRGYTGADTPRAMRGQGIAPGCKPHLFHAGFALMGLNRIETGCGVSNASSRRSIEKTPGFVFEGILREHSRNDAGEFEDQRYYGIIRRDWRALYADVRVEVLD